MKKHSSDRRAFEDGCGRRGCGRRSGTRLAHRKGGREAHGHATKRIRVGLIGCGNVSGAYLADLAARD